MQHHINSDDPLMSFVAEFANQKPNIQKIQPSPHKYISISN
jgi:hypothetical protein